MKKEITNCGLIALSEIFELKTTSIRTLINIAEDNGVRLYPYLVPLDEIDNVKLPAIFHCDNHFVYASKPIDLLGYNPTGYVITIDKQKLIEANNYLLSSVLGNTWVAVGVGGASAIMGGISAISAGKQKKKIAQEIANQKEVKLTNIADGLQVSTLGSDLQKEEQARLAATQTSALADAGSRALGVGVGRVSAQNQNVNANIAADLDAQQKNIDMMKAQDEGRIQMTKEQRQQAKLAALSSQYAGAQDAQAQGMGNMMQGFGMAAGAASGSGKLAGTPKTPKAKLTSVSEITPIGLKR